MSGSNFSSVNLRIISNDGRTVIAELQQIDKAAVGTARRAGAAASAGIQSAQRGAEAAARSITAGVGPALTRVQTQSAMAAREMAGQLLNVARTGSITSESIKSVIQHGSGMAFMFGPTGAIAGAVGLLGAAIFSMFKRTRDEIDATVKKFDDGVKAMVNAGDNAGLMKQAMDLSRGTPGENFEDGIDFRQRQRAALAAKISEAESTNPFAVLSDEFKDWQAQLVKLDAALAKDIAKFDQLRQAIVNVNNTPLTIKGLPAISVSASASAFTAAQDVAQGRRLGGLLGTAKIPFRAPVEDVVAKMQRDTLTSLVEGLKPLDITASIAKSGVGAKWLEDWDAMAEGMGQQMGATLADGIANGIAAAIQTGNIGEAFKAMTGTILEGIGSMMIEAGTHALAFAKMWARLQAWLAANPVAAIPVAIGLIAAGSAVRALGSSMRGSASGFGGGGSFSGGGGFGSGGQTIIDRGLINPLNGVVTSPGTITPRESVVNNWFVIGENDPRAQRLLVNMYDKGNARRGN